MSRHPSSRASKPSRPVNRFIEALHRLRDRSLQWSWFLQGVSPDRIGYGKGPLTWIRSATYRREQRDFRICLIEHEGWFGPLTAWAINKNSKRCHAVLNGDLSSADVIWVYCQDPLSSEMKARLEREIRQSARPDAVIVNAPSAYNAYHEPDAFKRLSEAGVRVPRYSFTDEDKGKLQVIYKSNGCHGGGKCLDTYDGSRPDMTAFEFLDCRQADGMYRRYRAHYIMGIVRPSEVFASTDWNVCADTAASIEYTFDMSDEEVDQVRKIAETLNLQYFAVDFIRRASDGQAVFTDVNVYPTVHSPRARVRSRGDFGGWHTFDARRRMGIPEPGGRDIWEAFDEAVAQMIQRSTESRARAMQRPTVDFVSQLDRLRPSPAPEEEIRALLPDFVPPPDRGASPAAGVEAKRRSSRRDLESADSSS